MAAHTSPYHKTLTCMTGCQTRTYVGQWLFNRGNAGNDMLIPKFFWERLGTAFPFLK